MTPNQAVSEIARLYNQYGGNHYDEDVNQIQHAVQAGRLALDEGYSEEVALAAFLHDIGHMTIEEAVEEEQHDAMYRHQLVGAQLLRDYGFSETVARLVEYHVAGKRYLTAVDPAYKNGLSQASITSLAFQGGPMEEAEVEAFDELEDRDLHIRIRHWDDLAKNPNDQDLDMQPFFDMALKHLEARAGQEQ